MVFSSHFFGGANGCLGSTHGTSSHCGGGAELDSFADAITLGVALALALALALMVYFFWLHSPGNPS